MGYGDNEEKVEVLVLRLVLARDRVGEAKDRFEDIEKMR